jgi:hypothetical protein
VTPPPRPQPLLGAASPLTAEVVSGPVRRALVLARFETALYLAVGASSEVLPVVTADALLLPTSLRLPMRSEALRWGVGPGDAVLVGGSSLRLGDQEVRVVRTWRPSRVDPGPATIPAHRMATLAGELASAAAAAAGSGAAAAAGPAGESGASLAESSAAVVRAALAGSDDVVRARVHELMGHGPGLTPSGDDALCAVLLVLRGAGAGAEGAHALVDSAVGAAARRTTSLSASLLHAAAQGYAVPAVADLVRAVLGDDPVARGPALAAVLAIGSSSGRDLVAGVAGALRVLAAAPAPSVPPSVAVRQPVGRGNP